MQVDTEFFLSSLVYVAAKLGVADYLVGGPKTAAELAPLVRCDESALYAFCAR
jgi:hypothetical protein